MLSAVSGCVRVLTPALGNMSKQRKIGKLRRPPNTKEMTQSRLNIEHEHGKGWGLRKLVRGGCLEVTVNRLCHTHTG